MKILVVDDSATIRQIVVKSLQALGLTEAREAADGRQALAALLHEDFDVILLDWNMPNLTGIETLRALRRAGCRTPVIMVTTEAEKSRVIEAIEAGANGYVIKPFSPHQLLEKVRHALPAVSR